MQRDHRPYYVKKAFLKVREFHVKHFLAPQFQSLGEGFTFMEPWNVEVFGAPVSLGRFANVIATSENKVRFTIWSRSREEGSIVVGDYCLICPGVRVSSAIEIVIHDNCMLANGVYITDSDWHDTYNRVAPIGKTDPVRIEQNVWVGDGAIVCKGVTIGENSIIGARSVVVDSIPANTIAAGNPARVVKTLDPNEKITTRAHWFADPERLYQEIDALDRKNLKDNTLADWMRSLLLPKKGD
jgi:acetyltransferase-like isoleucine patch superfamily enzyme